MLHSLYSVEDDDLTVVAVETGETGEMTALTLENDTLTGNEDQSTDCCDDHDINWHVIVDKAKGNGRRGDGRRDGSDSGGGSVSRERSRNQERKISTIIDIFLW